MAIHPTFQAAIRPSAAVLLAALVTACAAVPKPLPVPVPVPRPVPMPRPAPVPPPADWRDASQTPGDWSWEKVNGVSVASFGQRNISFVFRISCAADKRAVGIGISGIAQPGDPVVFTTTSIKRAVPAATGSASGILGTVGVSLAPRDPLLDAIAFSRGRFMVEVAGFAPLYLPSWPEISRVIEDCR